MQWLLIFKLVVLLTVANGAPVIATSFSAISSISHWTLVPYSLTDVL